MTFSWTWVKVETIRKDEFTGISENWKISMDFCHHHDLSRKSHLSPWGNLIEEKWKQNIFAPFIHLQRGFYTFIAALFDKVENIGK